MIRLGLVQPIAGAVNGEGQVPGLRNQLPQRGKGALCEFSNFLVAEPAQRLDADEQHGVAIDPSAGLHEFTLTRRRQEVLDVAAAAHDPAEHRRIDAIERLRVLHGQHIGAKGQHVIDLDGDGYPAAFLLCH